MISSGCLGSVLVAFMFAIALAGFAAAAKRRRKDEEAPVRHTRLSVLAAMSFFCGMAALLVLVSASIVSLVALHGEALQLGARDRQVLRAAAEVVLVTSLVPAVGALAFALGARSAIRESREGLRGTALSRAGAFLAVVSGFFALGGKAWVADRFDQGLGAVAAPEPERGFLGVQVELLETDQFGRPGGARVKSVGEGSPAAAAGLRPGDVIEAVDGVPVGADRPLDAALRPHRPGARLALQVSREGQSSRREAVLGVGPVLEKLPRTPPK